MTSIKAENRELDALDINQPKESPPRARRPAARGYYLALTFGTLLSSQGADAQKLDPSGPHSWLDVQLYAGFQLLPSGGLVRRPFRAARRKENVTPSSRALARGSGGASVTPCSGRSGHPGRTELNADARTHRLGGLRNAVLPGALARTAHDHEVAVAQGEAKAGASAPRGPQEEWPGRAERDDGNHRVRRTPAADPVAVPGHAVPTVPVEAHTGTDESLAELGPVVAVQCGASLGEQWMGQRLVSGVPAEQPRNGYLTLVHLASVLPPADIAQQYLEHILRAGDPAGQVVHPRSPAELLPGDAPRQGGQGSLLGEVPHRGLVRECHARHRTPSFRTCVRKPVDGAPPSRPAEAPGSGQGRHRIRSRVGQAAPAVGGGLPRARQAGEVRPPSNGDPVQEEGLFEQVVGWIHGNAPEGRGSSARVAAGG